MTTAMEEYLMIDNPAQAEQTSGNANDKMRGIGDNIIPLLFIWYEGDNKAPENVKSVVRSAFHRFLKDEGADTEFETIAKTAQKLRALFIGAASKNSSFVAALSNAVTQMFSRYQSRLPQTGKYFKQPDGSFARTPQPSVFDSTIQKLDQAIEGLATLLMAGLIDYKATTGINPIDIYTGSYFTPQQSEQSFIERHLKFPTSGLFTVNRRPRGTYYQMTFTGVDAQCLASTGNVVSELDGLTSISWSIHRGKHTPRTLGRPSPALRARGSRTIAGTMIFTVANRHPLLDLLPDNMASFMKLEFVNNQKQFRPIILSDQLPPFDLTIVFTNEYGNSAILILYGIDIVDEGSVISTDNLLTEVTLQYVAVGMDPIQEVEVDTDAGTIIVDPYGITKGGGEAFFRRREIMLRGVAYSDYESAYDDYYRTALAIGVGKKQ